MGKKRLHGRWPNTVQSFLYMKRTLVRLDLPMDVRHLWNYDNANRYIKTFMKKHK